MNIPEKWFFRGTEESENNCKNSDYYNYFFKKFGKDYGFYPRSRYYSDGGHNFTRNPPKRNFIEISFEDFKRYVLNEPEKVIELW